MTIDTINYGARYKSTITSTVNDKKCFESKEKKKRNIVTYDL